MAENNSQQNSSLAQENDDQFSQIIEGMLEVPMPLDGSCLFHALSYAINGHTDSTSEIRKRIVKHVCENWSRFQIWTDDGYGHNYRTKDMYEIDMSKARTFGSACELRAAAELFQIRICVYINGRSNQIYGVLKAPMKYLKFTGEDLGNGHFDAYIEKTNDNENSNKQRTYVENANGDSQNQSNLKKNNSSSKTLQNNVQVNNSKKTNRSSEVEAATSKLICQDVPKNSNKQGTDQERTSENERKQSKGNKSQKAKRNNLKEETTTTYKKTRGGITGHGQRYEVNLAFWLLLKGLERKNHFYLACNVYGFGNFDDDCFKYKRNEEWHLLLVQLKHKQQTLLDTHFLFDKLLSECYKSYQNIIDNTAEDKVFGGVAKENIHFIIFTNGTLPHLVNKKELNNKEIADYLWINSFDLNSKPVQLHEDYFDKCVIETFKDFAKRDILQRGKSTLLHILQQEFYENKDAKEVRDILVKATEEDIQKLLENEIIQKQFNQTQFRGFLKKLILFHNQPDDEKLSTFVFDKIINMSDEDPKQVYDDMFKQLTRWHESLSIALTRDNFYETLRNSPHEEVPVSKYFSRMCFSENNYMPRTIFNDQGEKAVEESIFKPNNFNKALILTADAGAGKTTIVNYLSQLYRHDMQIISLRLGKLSKIFENIRIAKDNDELTCQEFLNHSLNYKNKRIYEALMQFTKQQDFYILLDGYDEVICAANDVLDKINTIIKTLVKKYNVMITTRKSYEDRLQTLIECNLYSIKDFDGKEQKEFAKIFFKNNVKGIPQNDDDEKLERIVNEIFDIPANDEFLKIPLQLEMLLTSYLDKFLDYYHGGEEIALTPKFTDLYDFYSTFVERKINIYLDRTCQTQISQKKIKKERDNIFADHIYYSMKLFNHLHDEEFISSLDHDELMQVGFISSISANEDQVVFVHNTFADFFYAHRIISHLETARKLDMTDDKMFIGDFAYKMLNSKFINESLKLFNLEKNSIEDINDNNKYDTDLLGRNRLHIAIINGLTNVIKFLIRDNQCLNAKDLFGATPFLYAFTSDKVDGETIKLMLEQENCPISDPNKLQHTSLHYAILYRSVEITSLLLTDPRCPINSQTKNYNATPLHLALYNNKLEHVKALIGTQKCDLSLVDVHGRNCLHLAIRIKSVEITKLILPAQNCPLNSQDKDQRTPLHYAVAHNSLEIVKLLLEANCDCNIVNNNQKSALHLATDDNDRTETAKLLLNNSNSDISLTNSDNATCLHAAAHKNNYEIIKILVQRDNCPFNIQTNHQKLTALHLAIDNKAEESAIILIKSNKCELNLKDFDGNTCLHYAVLTNSLNIVKLLLEANCDCNIVDNDQNSALHLATYGDRTEIAKLLLNHSNSDISLTNSDNTTCLHAAAHKNNYEIIEILVKRDNCPFNIQIKDYKATALHVAIAKQAEESAIILIKSSKCELNLIDCNGRTCLHQAVMRNSPKIVQLLLDANCDYTIKDCDGKTACDIVYDKNLTEIIEIFNKKMEQNSASIPI